MKDFPIFAPSAEPPVMIAGGGGKAAQTARLLQATGANPNPIECPLSDLRGKSLRGRLSWARTVDSRVVDRVLRYHDRCVLRKRVRELRAYGLDDT